MRTWVSSAALAWLEVILQERFGHAFIIEARLGKILVISLPNDSRCITLALDPETFTRTDSDLACIQWDAAAEGWHTALSGSLPMPGKAALYKTLILPTINGWHIDYDILGLTYWMLTRQEEVGRKDLDEHGRFPAVASHAYQNNYLERPVVDEWLHVLGQVVAKTWPTLVLRQHTFSIRVSHDVDVPSRYGFRSWKGIVRGMGGDIFRRGDIVGALRAPWIRWRTKTELHPLDPFNTFEWIMDLSERHGLVSAFYFICGNTSSLDADYQPEHPAIRGLMRRIHQRGHEIGLHPSYGSYKRPDLLRAEALRLRRIAEEEGLAQSEWGGRMHYLRWEQPTTLCAWANAGMNYDSTLGYADRPGFRCGTCFEYPAFDPIEDKVLPLRVRPMVTMECTVMSPLYMGLGTGDIALNKFQQIKNACCAVGGCFTLLWHNSQFEMRSKRDMYKEILISSSR